MPAAIENVKGMPAMMRNAGIELSGASLQPSREQRGEGPPVADVVVDAVRMGLVGPMAEAKSDEQRESELKPNPGELHGGASLAPFLIGRQRWRRGGRHLLPGVPRTGLAGRGRFRIPAHSAAESRTL